MAIAERLEEVRQRIDAAARKSGRASSEVGLVAVSKTQSVEQIREAYDAGHRIFGENYAQELSAKATALANLSEIHWHYIGHVQSNKAKVLAEWATMVESLGSVAAAHAIARRVHALGHPPLPVLLEVNIAKEPQKHGVLPHELPALIDTVRAESSLTLVGLMTVPPAGNLDAARRSFEALAKLREHHGGHAVLPHLSMGMSGDFEEAIAAGATIVRVGTAIFGARGVLNN